MAATCDINQINEDKIKRARKAVADEASLFGLAETFKAIGEPSRVKIIYALLAEELCVCDLAAAVGMTPSAVSHQLRALRNLKLVKHRREGQMVHYSLDDKHIETLLAQGLEHVRERRHA